MIRVPDVGPDIITKVGAAASTAAMGTGFWAEVMSWNWSAISFITATVCAIGTFLWNGYYRRKTYKLQEDAYRKGVAFYELKE